MVTVRREAVVYGHCAVFRSPARRPHRLSHSSEPQAILKSPLLRLGAEGGSHMRPGNLREELWLNPA